MVNYWKQGLRRRRARSLLAGHDVYVNTIREADDLLRLALPEARKVRGAGPRRPVWGHFKGKHPFGTYHKDYLFDPHTGRIFGHDATNPHAHNKHVNIKLPDGRKVCIIIRRLP